MNRTERTNRQQPNRRIIYVIRLAWIIYLILGPRSPIRINDLYFSGNELEQIGFYLPTRRCAPSFCKRVLCSPPLYLVNLIVGGLSRWEGNTNWIGTHCTGQAGINKKLKSPFAIVLRSLMRIKMKEKGRIDPAACLQPDWELPTLRIEMGKPTLETCLSLALTCPSQTWLDVTFPFILSTSPSEPIRSSQ